MKKKNCPDCIRIDLKEVPHEINQLVMNEQAAHLQQGKKHRSKEWFIYKLLGGLIPKENDKSE